MDKVTFPEAETKYFPIGNDEYQELYIKHDGEWRRVTFITTGPAVQYFVEESPEERVKSWEQRNVIREKTE